MAYANYSSPANVPKNIWSTLYLLVYFYVATVFTKHIGFISLCNFIIIHHRSIFMILANFDSIEYKHLMCSSILWRKN